jgi:hypothetical protein
MVEYWFGFQLCVDAQKERECCAHMVKREYKRTIFLQSNSGRIEMI